MPGILLYTCPLLQVSSHPVRKMHSVFIPFGWGRELGRRAASLQFQGQHSHCAWRDGASWSSLSALWGWERELSDVLGGNSEEVPLLSHRCVSRVAAKWAPGMACLKEGVGSCPQCMSLRTTRLRLDSWLHFLMIVLPLNQLSLSFLACKMGKYLHHLRS